MNQEDKLSPVVAGIHHITAIAGDAQKNYSFYTQVLGLRLVKKTVNFDDPQTYHFYFGNEKGEPGTIITFFPWSEFAQRGRKGTGQVATIAYAISKDSVLYWTNRLTDSGISFTGPFNRFDEEVILLEDPDGIEIELAAGKNNLPPGWNNGNIPAEHSIRGFYGAAFSLNNTDGTAKVLTDLLGFKKVTEEGNRTRYSSTGSNIGSYIDILQLNGTLNGTMGAGAVHHIAFRAENEEAQLNLRTRLIKNNLAVTEVVDRSYFKSIYFREPGNILFEIATDAPGFLIDEAVTALGQELKLPPWLEPERSKIENSLPPLKQN
jgi:glyoxalase family protein